VSLEDELRQIDIEIKKLKIQFDLYFSGACPRPPTDQRDALEKSIKRYQGASIKSFADRFLYNSLVNKFNAFQELWIKGMKAKEEGARVHPMALRAAQQAAMAQMGGANGPSAASERIVEALRGGDAGAGSGDPETSRGADLPAPGAGRPRSPDGLVASLRLSATARDESALQSLYKDFVAAKGLAGDTKVPSFDTFAREIGRHAATLKGKSNCEAIEFKIYCVDKKVSLKVRPAK